MLLCVQALDLIGLKPTEAQRQALRSGLRADAAGTVAFTGNFQTLHRFVVVETVFSSNCGSLCDRAEFESLTRELFRPQLEELAVTKPGSRFTSDDLSSLLESPTEPQVSLIHRSIITC